MNLPYSLIIEATEEPDFLGFFSPDLEGFTGIGHSIEDCLYKAKWGMREHIELLKERGLRIPPQTKNPKVIVQNKEKLPACLRTPDSRDGPAPPALGGPETKHVAILKRNPCANQ